MTDAITWTNDTRLLSDLVPWEHNPKRMTKKQADGLRLSIERFGFAVPFLIGPDQAIYDGHQRQTLMNAIREYGPNATVDVRVSSRPLTDDERRELVVRLKQNQAGWDFDMLPNLYEREELLEWGFEPEELGMFADEPAGDDPVAQIDKAEELREKWGVSLGDLWQLGEHWLICGDCTDAAVVARVMGGERAALLVTSPPYGVGKEYESGGIEEWRMLVNRSFDAATDCPLWFVNLGDRKTGNDGYEAHTFGLMVSDFENKGYRLLSLRVWAKDAAWAGQNPYWRQTYKAVDDFEFLGLFAQDKPKHSDRLTDEENKEWGYRGVWSIASVRENKVHSAGFPVELPERAVKMLTDAGAIVYEPFLGSGTTLIACERLGRRARCVEISPAYCAVAIERFYVMTGVEPVLLDTR